MILTALAFVTSIQTVSDPVANLLLIDAQLLAAIELSFDITFAALVFITLIVTICEAVATPPLRDATAIEALEFVLGAICRLFERDFW